MSLCPTSALCSRKRAAHISGKNHFLTTEEPGRREREPSVWPHVYSGFSEIHTIVLNMVKVSIFKKSQYFIAIAILTTMWVF